MSWHHLSAIAAAAVLWGTPAAASQWQPEIVGFEDPPSHEMEIVRSDVDATALVTPELVGADREAEGAPQQAAAKESGPGEQLAHRCACR